MSSARHMPQGVRDLMPSACKRKRMLESGLLTLFSRWGYQEVQTPALEYLDTFLRGGEQSPERLFKLTDWEGRILALRSELTTSLARLAAMNMKEEPLPLRLCYAQEAFTFLRSLNGGRSQYQQAGVELMGAPEETADAEVIALSIQALKAMGLRDIQLEIGQVDFFLGLVEEAGLDTTIAEHLREQVEQKNMLGIELLLKGTPVGSAFKQTLSRLPMLYGQLDVLDEARQMTQNTRCLKALERIQAVFSILEEYGVAEYVTIDLGMVHALHYYTGIIFRGMTMGIGQPVLSGGRYDNLMGDFGHPLPAVGFAVEVDRVLDALERQMEAETVLDGPDMLFAFTPPVRALAFGRMEHMRAQGFSAIPMETADDAQAIQQAKALGARCAQRIDGIKNPIIYQGGDE